MQRLLPKTDYRLDKDGVAGGTTFSVEVASNMASYCTATRKMAPDAQATYYLKKTVPIDGVFEKKKYKSVETAQSDIWGTSYGAIRVFSADNTFYENLQAIPVEADKYKNGFLTAANKFMNSTLDDFISYF